MTLFASGYSATSGSAATPTATEAGLSCESTAAPAASCAARKAAAAAGLTAPRASGRPAVLATFLSISRSQRSLTVHPAPRSSSAPTPKSARRWAVEAGSRGGAAAAAERRSAEARSGDCDASASEAGEGQGEEVALASTMDQAHGHASSQVPAGLSSLASSAKGHRRRGRTRESQWEESGEGGEEEEGSEDDDDDVSSAPAAGQVPSSLSFGL